MNPVCQANIFADILDERARQEKKWGQQNHHPDYWQGILGEEFGEVCKAVIERDLESYRKELIHTAAVAFSMLECLDRNPNPFTKVDQSNP